MTNDRVEGMLYFYTEQGHVRVYVFDHSVQIADMWVNPDHRRIGEGQRLLSMCLEFARYLRLKTITLHVDMMNGPAVALYRKNGFLVVESDHHMELKL